MDDGYMDELANRGLLGCRSRLLAMFWLLTLPLF